ADPGRRRGAPRVRGGGAGQLPARGPLDLPDLPQGHARHAPGERTGEPHRLRRRREAGGLPGGRAIRLGGRRDPPGERLARAGSRTRPGHLPDRVRHLPPARWPGGRRRLPTARRQRDADGQGARDRNRARGALRTAGREGPDLRRRDAVARAPRRPRDRRRAHLRAQQLRQPRRGRARGRGGARARDARRGAVGGGALNVAGAVVAGLGLALAAVAPAAASGAPPGMRLVPAGYVIAFQPAEGDAAGSWVAPFWLDERPVTNAEFLAFVRERPVWRRSRASRRAVDDSYLAHWAGDL